jgi:hypothetical protein
VKNEGHLFKIFAKEVPQNLISGGSYYPCIGEVLSGVYQGGVLILKKD